MFVVIISDDVEQCSHHRGSLRIPWGFSAKCVTVGLLGRLWRFSSVTLVCNFGVETLLWRLRCGLTLDWRLGCFSNRKKNK